MTPKEKAKELFLSYLRVLAFYVKAVDGKILAKSFSLIAVDEILKSNYKNTLNDLGYISTSKELDDYWQEVKQEIEKL